MRMCVCVCVCVVYSQFPSSVNDSWDMGKEQAQGVKKVVFNISGESSQVPFIVLRTH